MSISQISLNTASMDGLESFFPKPKRSKLDEAVSNNSTAIFSDVSQKKYPLIPIAITLKSIPSPFGLIIIAHPHFPDSTSRPQAVNVTNPINQSLLNGEEDLGPRKTNAKRKGDNRISWSPQMKKELIFLRGNGKSWDEVAEGVSKVANRVISQTACYRQIIKIAPEQVISTPRWSGEDRQFLADEVNKGTSFIEIAKMLGRTEKACITKFHYE